VIFRLIYTSMASASIKEPNIQDILKAARANNPNVDLTGVLLFHDDTFLQVLEGPKNAVLALVAKIETDPRNHGLIEIFREESEARIFPDWSMAYVPIDTALVSVRKVIESYESDVIQVSYGRMEDKTDVDIRKPWFL